MPYLSLAQLRYRLYLQYSNMLTDHSDIIESRQVSHLPKLPVHPMMSCKLQGQNSPVLSPRPTDARRFLILARRG
ncbi:hypothetical protein BGLA2_420120 [Burkholderia gladioli]|nr:hypothetical protein BGLA2_420120 [Burkholderia gladioli]